MTEQLYTYAWRNNMKRATLHGRTCRVLARGRMNSALVEFPDTGQREVISRNALRKATWMTENDHGAKGPRPEYSESAPATEAARDH